MDEDDERLRRAELEGIQKANFENRFNSVETKVLIAWLYIGPLHAIASNWKALAIIAGLVAWFNRPGILEAIRTLLGVQP